MSRRAVSLWRRVARWLCSVSHVNLVGRYSNDGLRVAKSVVNGQRSVPSKVGLFVVLVRAAVGFCPFVSLFACGYGYEDCSIGDFLRADGVVLCAPLVCNCLTGPNRIFASTWGALGRVPGMFFEAVFRLHLIYVSFSWWRQGRVLLQGSGFVMPPVMSQVSSFSNFLEVVVYRVDAPHCGAFRRTFVRVVAAL